MALQCHDPITIFTMDDLNDFPLIEVPKEHLMS